MLSFLREQQNDGSPKQKSAEPVDGAQLGDAKKGQEQDYITVESKGDSVRRSTTILLILFVVGGIFLFFMIKRSVPSQASAAGVSEEELEIERAIAQVTGIKSEMFERMDKIVDKFYEFSDVQQVEVGELRKNPFNSSVYLFGLDEGANSGANEVDLLEFRREQVKQESKDLELLSIMRSSGKACCIINGKVLHEGDSIKSFSVSQIGDNFVKLHWVSENKADSEKSLEDFGILLKLMD